MEDLKILWQKIKEFIKAFCQEEWSPTRTGIVVALLSILIMAWWRPWGAVGAFRNWGDWILWQGGSSTVTWPSWPALSMRTAHPS